MYFTRGEIIEAERRVRRWVENFPLNHLAGDCIGSSLRYFSECNLRVVLVTYGTKKSNGLGYLRSILESEGVGVREIKECSHCIDRIFNHYHHLRSRGLHWTAQAEFIDLYSSFFGAEEFCQYFRKMIYNIEDSMTENLFDYSVLHLISCHHGHHRSQAFCELLAKLLRRHWPFLEVDTWHLDEEWNLRPGADLEEFEFETHFKVPLLKALSPPIYFRPLQFRRVTMPVVIVGGTVEEDRT